MKRNCPKAMDGVHRLLPSIEPSFRWVCVLCFQQLKIASGIKIPRSPTGG